ncbi:MAG: thiolase family protein [Actinobacteria bacterium]|jgi:acetyl-CoA acyltransferase|nr:thiolase family protein [Actinomycetota bacterium]NCV98163.1 thiolase family protein [Actinomycetota bacterium]NCW41750.1 thiolase family protein [Actinomycetota bacterium]NCW95100.1 thiolase family protein [Actinomycetota bacterium]NCX64553.1 thiolase family protein [Actinomycetota bacterium]
MQTQDVFFIDGVRTPFGKAGEKGVYWKTRADDLVVKTMIGLLERHPDLPKEAIDDVAIAAATQYGDQGLQIGRSASILAGLPLSVPGYSIDRWCAGAMTSVTTTGSAIGIGAYDIALAGGVEHMGHHPMGEGADPNPRFLAEKLVDPSAMNMGNTAEKIHDRFPHLTKERSDAFAVASQQKAAKAYADGKIQKDLIPVSAASDAGWNLVTTDELLRPESNLEGMKDLKTPFRPHGKVTAGNASPLTDGATMSLIAGEGAVKKYGLKPKMKMVSFAFAGVEPEIMGIGPIPATEKALAKAGLKMDDIGLIEINEAFAIQVLSFLDHFGLADDDPKINPWGGAIAMGHPLASSGVRLMNQLARHFEDNPKVRYGMTTMCIGLGMGGTVIWENSNYKG